ncbi:MAG: SUMF1/EgtB/PvdO family nonheme iron enzyme, partial [Bacteroidota bacterium]
MNVNLVSTILLITFILANCSHAQERSLTVSLPDNTVLELVYIPPGSFLMGSLPDELDRHGDEGPVRNVMISKGFYLGKYELTQARFVGTKIVNALGEAYARFIFNGGFLHGDPHPG